MILEKGNISYPVLIELDEDNTFIVSCPILKGCRSYGYTLDEALENIKEAIELCIESDAFSSHENKYIGISEISLDNSNLSANYA